ncbi:TraR/DksA family transcriptional regulator [Pseudomonas proteolytica]|uniref:TraR/DksA C4-type zinc finger protein n=1 Tax=Pseudomonas TaxID=286 RepID=UPI00147671E7|nr:MULTISPECIES: TraR/DksA C4-type zinc finger protein [Pseudomonas]NMY85877.1 TraR/DksA family transcriptional regulator [Pseudomonas sp. WS 5411]NMZ11685.1 TraR/DksA family transcriptional regulator [Pseudomonas proteolytica]
MDVFDRASVVEEATREAAIAAHLAQARQLVGVSATHCGDCGTVIPEARRLALPGVLLCVDCKSVHEEMNRK